MVGSLDSEIYTISSTMSFSFTAPSQTPPLSSIHSRIRTMKASKKFSNPVGKTKQMLMKKKQSSRAIAERMVALKKLIPSTDGATTADEIFKEVANYILLLRTRIEVLKQLVEFYSINAAEESANDST